MLILVLWAFASRAEEPEPGPPQTARAVYAPGDFLEREQSPPFGHAGEIEYTRPAPELETPRPGCPNWLELNALARGYYLNDQRIQWSGQEATFGAEAVFAPKVRRSVGLWDTAVEGEFYLNLPFDRNILSDTPERQSYAANFEVETFEISQLFIKVQREELLFAVGKMVTPFGRTYFPVFTNARIDAPFIRTEAIGWRETGLLIGYERDWLVGHVALTNGCEDGDTNSSKALVARLGLEGENWAVGSSIKQQDGIGSETQKEFDSQIGMDAMVRVSRFILSGEMVYDEYGLRHPDLDPNDITWKRSIYYRDQNYRDDMPISGVGYYLDLGYQGDRWLTSFNYGEYYPEHIGDPRHDVTNRRSILKTAYSCTEWLDVYGALILENGGYLAQADRPRQGQVMLVGLQYTF
jgi:hypothetical protein